MMNGSIITALLQWRFQHSLMNAERLIPFECLVGTNAVRQPTPLLAICAKMAVHMRIDKHFQDLFATQGGSIASLGRHLFERTPFASS